MRGITIAALAAVVALAACTRTDDGKVVVERPGEVQVTTKKDTLAVPQVNVGTTEDTIEVPTVQVTKQKRVIKRPVVGVKNP